MVRAHKNMEPVPEKTSERRVSSPIGIPSSKVASLNQAYQSIIESESPASNSPLGSPGNYVSPSILSSSAPQRGNNIHTTRALKDSHHDSEESISEILDHLPDCSPAFNTVFSELVKLEAERREKENTASNSDQHDRHKASAQSTPTLLRKDVKVIRFELPEMRPRASSHSVARKPRVKESPSSAHSTPAMSRRNKAKNGLTIAKPVNMVPKYKFLTETITVSHEDILKEQHAQEKFRNGFPSPKSIFGALEERSSPSH